MTIQYQLLLEADYRALRYQVLLNVEEGGTVKLAPYTDSRNFVTMGIGFNLHDAGVRGEVLAFFGVAAGSASDLTLNAILSQTWTAADMGLVQAGLDAAIAQSGGRNQFRFNDENEVRTFLNTFIVPYENRVSNQLPTVPQFSRERAVLLSLHYNEQANPALRLLGAGLTAAIASGDRAEAWYEIRYRSNRLDEAGVAKRRYYEAEVFGLYDADSPLTASLEESLGVYAMYSVHRREILGEEVLFGPGGTQGDQIAAANSDYSTVGTPYVVQTLEGSLAPAGVTLIAKYAPDQVGQINFLDILVGADGNDVDEQLVARARQGYLLDVGAVASYLLIGRGGRRDVLTGGEGSDVLVGGEGEDELNGSAGNDTYYFEAGDGDDRIVGDDDTGRIKIDDDVITGANAVAWVDPIRPNRPGWRWVEHDRVFYATLLDGDFNNGTLLIQPSGVGGGDSIEIELWKSGDLGLVLNAAPATAILPGSLPANPWSDPNFGASTESTEVLEGRSSLFGVAFNSPVPVGAQLRLELSGTAGDPSVVNGAETLPFVNGAVQFDLVPNQSLLNLALLSGGDFDVDQQVTVTATLLDAQGNPIGAAATMNVLFEATVEPSGMPAFDWESIQTSPYSGFIYGGGTNDHVVGYDGTMFVDEIHGWQGSDWLQGRDGRDILFGYHLNVDTAAAGQSLLPDGDDLIEGGADGDMLYGGGGADRVYADASVDLSAAIAAGNVAPNLAGQGDILQGGEGDDTLVGANRADLISGGEGDDVLVGGGGDDLLTGDTTYVAGEGAQFHFATWLDMWSITLTINGNTYDYDVVGGIERHRVYYENDGGSTTFVEDYDDGADTIHAGAGNDGVIAGGGGDFVDGGPGADNLFGEDGNDTLLGGADNDRIVGGSVGDFSGDDFIDGGDGNDTLFGSDYRDVLYGGSGDDMLQADDHTELDGEDYLNGEDGNDTLFGGGGADRLIGGAGNDELFGESSGVLSTMHGNDYLDGGDGNDTLHGRGGADTLIGGAGVDTLFGDLQSETTLYGADYLFGGAGADTLVGAGGADTLEGGDDDDQLYGDSTSTPTSVHGADHIDGGAGNDTVFGGGSDDSVVGGEGNDIVYGEAGNDQLRGDAGDDYLSGDAGSDSLNGGDGTDTLYGGDGNDVLTAGVGADYLNGGAGDDTYFFSGADLAPVNNVLDTLDDTSGNDVVVFDASMSLADLIVGSPPGSGNLRISNSSGTAVLSIAGLLAGTSSVREFRFATGEVVSAHRLISERYGQPISAYTFDSNIFMFGGNQADNLTADGNAVTISGGLGNDSLTGGFGTNTYLFTRGDGNDYIYDESYGSGVLNTLELTDVFVPEFSLHYSQATGARLLISDGGGSIQLGLFDLANVFSPRTIDEIRFVDAEVSMTWAEFLNTAGIDIGGGLGSVLNGTPVSDRITGSSTNETINAGAGNDRVDGGAGNDTMDGGTGSDTYLFGVGSGQDTINNSDTAAGKTDVLVIDSALTRSELRLVRYEDALIVRVAASGDRVLVSNFFNGAGLDEVRLSGGIVYTPASVVLDDVQSQATVGNDEVYGSAAADVIDALAGDDAVFAGDGDDVVAGNDGADVLRGQAGNDVLDGGRRSDTLYGGDGNDTLMGGAVELDTLYGEGGDDVLIGRGTLDGGDGNDQLTGDLTSDDLSGGTGDDVLAGGGAGGGGSLDFLMGGAGNDTYVVRRGDNAVITQNDDSPGRLDTLRFGPDILPSQLSFSSDWSGRLSIRVNSSGAQPGAGVDILSYLVDDAFTNKIDRVLFDADPGTVWTGAQLEALAMQPSNEHQYIRGTLAGDVLNGLGGNDFIYGRDGNDEMLGGEGDDQLYGGAGDDVLGGGPSSDRLEGGTGSDTYLYNLGDGTDTIVNFDSTGATDVILFGAGILPGNVTVRRLSSPNTDMRLTIYHPITNAVLGSINLLGVFGPSAADTIDEVRFSDVPGTVWTRADLLALTLSGNGTDETLTGFSTNDLIRGNGGNDRLDGAAGNDDLAGGPGNDALKGGTGDDIFRFGHGQGFDEISDTSGFNRIVLDAGITPADVALYRTSSATTLHPGFLPAKTADGLALVLNGTGEQLWVRNFFVASRPIGEIVFADGTVWNAAAIDANTINQGGIADSFAGTTANDSYVVDHPSDSITEAAGGGTDSATSSVTFTLPGNVENLTLSGVLNINATGNTLVNVLTGNSGDNYLHGGGSVSAPDGADTLIGGAGNDIYEVFKGTGTNYFNDVVIEDVNGGYDTIIASSHSAVLPANVEALTVLSFSGSTSTAQVFTGNELDNVIDARSATWAGYGFRIDGGLGADLMIGPTAGVPANQIDLVIRYVVDNIGDVVIGGSTYWDLVQAPFDYTLPDTVERLELTGATASTGTGNASSNWLNGSTSTGANLLIGGAGNDEYTVGPGDTAQESAGGGTDTVVLTMPAAGTNVYDLAQFPNIENLSVTGGAGAATLVGDVGANRLVGNSSANTLQGGAGDDVLEGDFSNDSLFGGEGNDRLDGGVGVDQMTGSLGDDLYIVSVATDGVVELANEGTDTVLSMATYTLGNHVENLTLDGTSAISGTGNALDNVLRGNSAINTLTGQAGNDTLDGRGNADNMIGGLGDDIYFVDVSGDVTTESANQGIDTVNSSVTRTLSADIEILFLTGFSNISGTGSALANLLRGNSSVNTLVGATGTDIVEGGGGADILSNASNNTLLNGGAANDTMTGTSNNDLLIGGLGTDALTTGEGADVIVFNQGEGQDTVAASTAKDNVVSLGGGILYTDLLFQKSGNDLILKTGGSDQITFANYYSSSSNRSVDKLQIVIEGTSDYDSGSVDALRNKKIATFNFDGLVAAFDTALIANPGLTTWALTNALVAQHLGGSDTAAIGGDLAYRYGRFDTLSDISFTPAVAILAAAGFGTTAQTLQSLASLQDSSARLS